jgi:O-ureido-D-serine cyclo-ligase
VKPRIALVTARAARGLDEDQPPLQEALRAAGTLVEVADWDDPQVDWTSFDAAILRSTWDYTDRLAEFLAWIDRTAGLTALFNPASMVRWNTDKHYLGDLARSGVPTVPGAFVEPGTPVAAAIDEFLHAQAAAELVVKPAVGAGSRDTSRYKRGARDAIVAHAKRLVDAGRSALLQPYLDRVEVYGETALIFFSGRFSHAIRKGPMLADPDAVGSQPALSDTGPGGANGGLFVSEHITPRAAAAEEIKVATQALAAIPYTTPLYARVDLIRATDGQPLLLELELTEPSLFFAHAPGAALRFAQTVLQVTRVGMPDLAGE